TCFFCRMTQQGFLRLATNPAVFGKHAVTMAQAWPMPASLLPASPQGVENHWRGFTQHRSFSPKLWNDAYLAAFALAAQLEAVSFDTVFTQFQGVKCLILP